MNFKWFQNKLTFVIIPEANGSVVRLKLARGVVCSVAASVMITVGAAAFLYLQHAHTAASTFLKTSELSGRTAKLEQALTSKNRRIEELQNDIYMLSKQAAEVHSQVAQMKKLEEDLQKLAPVSAEKKRGKRRPACGRSLDRRHGGCLRRARHGRSGRPRHP